MAVNLNAATGGLQQADDQVDDRAFSAAGLADEADPLALANVEREKAETDRHRFGFFVRRGGNAKANRSKVASTTKNDRGGR